eukprot:scaffold449708_cov19-Prasinocladus_malaysianus.AAC.1
MSNVARHSDTVSIHLYSFQRREIILTARTMGERELTDNAIKQSRSSLGLLPHLEVIAVNPGCLDGLRLGTFASAGQIVHHGLAAHGCHAFVRQKQLHSMANHHILENDASFTIQNKKRLANHIAQLHCSIGKEKS